MFRLLRWRLGRTLLRAAGRRCGGCAARLLPERAGDTGPGAEGRPSRGTPARGQGLLPLLAGERRAPGRGRAGGRGRGPVPVTSEPLLAALAWFSRPAAAAEQSEEDSTDEVEAEIIQLLKRAKVRGLGRARALSALLSLGLDELTPVARLGSVQTGPR